MHKHPSGSGILHRKILIVTQCSARKTSRELFNVSIDFFSKIPETKEILPKRKKI